MTTPRPSYWAASTPETRGSLRAQPTGSRPLARDWNTQDPASGHVGDVLRFEVDAGCVVRFEPRRVGGAQELDEFNWHIVGVAEFRP